MGKMRFVAAILVALVAFPLLATAEQESSSETTTDTLIVAAAAPWVKDIDHELAADFETETGIRIGYQLNPGGQYEDVVRTKINTGNAPDVMMWFSGSGLRTLPLDQFVDLSDQDWVSRVKAPHRIGSTVDGTLYGMNSWSADFSGMLYNPELFDRLGIEVPRTFNELKVACAVLAANGITPIFENGGSSWHLSHWFNVASSAALLRDPELYEKLNTNQIKLVEIPEFVRLLEQMQELHDLGYFGDEVLSQVTSDSFEGMTTEQFGMMHIWPAYQVEMENGVPGRGAIEYKMFPVPLGFEPDEVARAVPVSSGGLVFVVPDGPNKEAALEFINFRARQDVLDKYYAARQDFANPGFVDITTGYEPNAQRALLEIADEQVLAFGSGAFFFDEKFYTDSVRGLLIGEATPEEVLSQIDDYRLQLGRAIGQEGFN